MKIIESFAVFEKLLHKEKSIRKALDSNFCVFQYIKKDGEKRKAFGTLKSDFISKWWKPSGEESPSIDALRLQGYIQYWDIERKNFRQFTMDEGVHLLEEYATAEEMAEKYPELRKKLGLPKYDEKKKEKNGDEKTDKGNDESGDDGKK